MCRQTHRHIPHIPVCTVYLSSICHLSISSACLYARAFLFIRNNFEATVNFCHLKCLCSPGVIDTEQTCLFFPPTYKYKCAIEDALAGEGRLSLCAVTLKCLTHPEQGYRYWQQSTGLLEWKNDSQHSSQQQTFHPKGCEIHWQVWMLMIPWRLAQVSALCPWEVSR